MSTGDWRVGLEPLDAEVEAELEVTGEVPAWLTGTLVRNGPGRWTARAGGAGQRAGHWFDGLAMLHRFGVSAGRVHYANRYVRSPAWRAAEEQGRFAFPEVAVVPRRSLRQRVRALRTPPSPGTNTSVNVYRLGGRPVAVTETPDAIPFDPVTLETLPPVSYTDDLPTSLDGAHPHHDPRRGALVNLGVEYGRRSTYHVYELPDGSLQRRSIAAVPTDRPSYMHSFAMTDRFVVLVEYPLVADPFALLAGRSFLEANTWRPERGTRFTVVERASGAVVTRTRTAPFFCFHQVNAFEDDGDLVVDLPVMPGERALHQFALDEMHGGSARSPAGELRRYRVPLDGGPVTYRLLSATVLEFPRISYERSSGRPHRWVWGTGADGTLTTALADRLVKVDAETGAATTWSRPGCWPGEPVPVAPPARDGAPEPAEDEGVVLSLVLDAAARRSFLLVLDAATLTEVARADLPHAVPLGFHGQWFGEPPAAA